MNKRQRKKSVKREYQRMGDMLAASQKEMIKFWMTHKTQDEQEARLIKDNLRCLVEYDRGCREEKQRLKQARARAWRNRRKVIV